jgi:hypothetical protein
MGAEPIPDPDHEEAPTMSEQETLAMVPATEHGEIVLLLYPPDRSDS